MGSQLKFVIPKLLLEECLNLNEGKLVSFTLESENENEQHIEIIFKYVDKESLHVEIKGTPQQRIKKEESSPTKQTSFIRKSPRFRKQNQNLWDVLQPSEELNSEISNNNLASKQIKKSTQEYSYDESLEANYDLDEEVMNQESNIENIAKVKPDSKEENGNKLGDGENIKKESNCISDSGVSHSSFTKNDVKSEAISRDREIEFQQRSNETTGETNMDFTINSAGEVFSMDDLDEIVISESCKIKKDANGRYPCFMCSKSVLNLFTHIRFMHKENPEYMNTMKKLKKIFKSSSCKLCSRIFNNVQMLKKHEDIAHKNVKSSVGVKCNICGAILRNKDSLRSHFKLVHSGQDENKFSCEKCDLGFNSEEQLKRHSKHECGLTFSCEDCNFTTSAYKFYLKHVELNHSNSYYQVSDCEICPKRLKNIHCLYRHVLTNHKDSPNYQEEVERLKSLQRVKCPYCSVMLKSRSIKRHIMTVHAQQEQTIFKCQECGILLKNVDTLRSHIKNVHETTGRNFACSKCSTTFRTKNNLRYHLTNVHADPNVQYKCKECDYTTSSKKYLKNHYGQTHVNANYMCGECGRTFKTPDKLRRHNTLIHRPHEIKRHICSICDKEFNVKANLTKHMKTIHLKQHAYKCCICDGGFQTVNVMKQHYVKRHDLTTTQASEYLSSSKTKDVQYNTEEIASREVPMPPEPVVPLLVHAELPKQYNYNTGADRYSSTSFVQGPEIGLIVDHTMDISSNSPIEDGQVIEYPKYVKLGTGANQEVMVEMQEEPQTVFVEDQGIMYQEQEVTTLSMDYDNHDQ